jgi:amino acid transporter
VAFIIGWNLALEFTIGASAIAVGLGGYLNALLESVFGLQIPSALAAPPGDGGAFNVPAVPLVVVLVVLLVHGVRLTSRGQHRGDAQSQRDMPIGIIGSLAIVTLLYVAVALVITGMVPFKQLAGESPIADAFQAKGFDIVATIVFFGALVATAKTTMILMLGQSRVSFAMARDRLLPGRLAQTHPRFHTPQRLTLIVGAGVIVLAGLVPLEALAELVNIGTLSAFLLAAAGVLYLRRVEPDRQRPFRAPLMPVLPVLSMAASIYLMTTLSGGTWARFGAWMVLGLIVYFLYSRRGRPRPPTANQPRRAPTICVTPASSHSSSSKPRSRSASRRSRDLNT